MQNLVGESDDPNVAAVQGTHTAGAGAVIGSSDAGRGVIGLSKTGHGVWGQTDGEGAGVYGESGGFNAVRGISHAGNGHGAVVGISDNATDSAGPGIYGLSRSAGVLGESTGFNAVRGITHAGNGHGAVVGISDNTTDQAGPGVYGQSRAAGVVGESETWYGIYGHSASMTGGAGAGGEGVTGVTGTGTSWVGVYGETRAKDIGVPGVFGEGKDGGMGVKGHARAENAAGVAGYQLANAGPGVYGEGAPAGYFKGDLVVTGDVFLSGADYAEELTVADVEVVPGMVVVLDDDGRVRPCVREYDDRVAGIVSGGGEVRPALVLDRHDGGAPVALMGKLWVFADADEAPIRPGDQLTTSRAPGHARRVVERDRAFGAVVGKALTALLSGRGLVRVLVSAS